MTLEAGTRVGPFAILGPLGAGGLGEVYRARDERLGRDVALKTLPQSLLDDSDAVARFAREARAASALNHPNIVTIYEIGDTASGSYIAMELIRGRTMRELLPHRPGRAELLAIFAQIARALAVAHEAEIVHRDVKPENVMVRDDGYVKVLDFGLARLARSDGAASPLDAVTKSGLVAGTARYMSPEQASGEAIGVSSDVFSLGIMMYEALVGRHPFDATTVLATIAAIISDATVAPSRIAPDLPASLDALILQMLAKDARSRPSASQVAEQLQALIQGSTHVSAAAVARSWNTVGREAEREMLRRAFADAESGRSALVCVVGEPGIGKTTLVEDFLRERAAEGRAHFAATGRCSERLAGAEAYLPLIELIEALVRTDANGSRAATTVRQLAPSWYAQLGLAASASVPPTPAPTMSQERMKRELSALVLELSRTAPLVMVLEDVHWADAASVDMLSYVTSRLTGARVLLVATYRPSELRSANHPFLALQKELEGRSLAREVALPFLELADVERYLDITYPGHRLPAALARVIHARTEGNPLFMADVLRYLADRRVIERESDGWTLSKPVEEIERDLPASVTSMVSRTLQRLGDDDRKLLTAASVQGVEFDVIVVARALDIDAADLEERLAALARLHPLIRKVRERELPDRSITETYRFVHVLYQNALYGDLPPARRAALSKSVAGALLAVQGAKHTEIAAELAMLFEAARDLPRAADYFLLAAQQAHRLFASREAETLARRGLGLVETIAEGPARDLTEFRLQMARGVSLAYSRGPTLAEVGDIFRRALELANRLGDDRLRFLSSSALWAHHDFRAEIAQALEISRDMERLADALGEAVLLSAAHLMYGATELQVPAFASSRAHHERGIVSYPADELAKYRGALLADPMPLNVALTGRALWHLGFPDSALRHIDDGLARARASDPYTRALVLYYRAMVQVFRREPKAALETIAEVMAMAQEHDLLQVVVWMHLLHGWSIAALGNAEQGIAEMSETLRRLRAMGSDRARPQFMALLADALLRSGRVDEGLAAVADGLESAERTGARFFDPELHRLRGELMLAGDRVLLKPARTCFRTAIAIAEAQEQRSLGLRAELSLGRQLAHAGRADEAVSRLTHALAWFTEGATTADVTDARSFLRGIDAAQPTLQ